MQENEMQMLEEIGSFYYQRAIQEFEAGEYEAAVQNFIKVYEMGLCREEILEILYSCFITPNEAEFQKNYEQNAEELTGFRYENTEIDFIPVSDNCYYLYNKKEQTFQGTFRLENFGEREKNFHSVLVADMWDIREVLPILQKTEYRTIYYLVNEEKSKFYSFLKLPGFAEMYLHNGLCFENTDMMQMFFTEYTDYYLPKTVLGARGKEYVAMLSDIHEMRLRKVDDERKNVFLSICIPTYNRGHMLIENVREMLLLQYDAEIEIVVSDDGSTENVEGYYEVEAIADSRLKCMRFDKNQGYASNVLNVLKMASGQFAILTSDENALILDNIEELLNSLYRKIDKGVVEITGYGPTFTPLERMSEQDTPSGMFSMYNGLNMNILACCAFNMDVAHQYQVLERCMDLRGNLYVDLYVHMVVAFFMGKYAAHYRIPVAVWRERDAGGVGGFSEKGKKLLRYMHPASRMAQHEAVMQLVELFYARGSEIYNWFFVNYLSKTYYLLQLARRVYKDEFDAQYEWREVCEDLYNYSLRQIQAYGLPEDVKKNVCVIYQGYID